MYFPVILGEIETKCAKRLFITSDVREQELQLKEETKEVSFGISMEVNELHLIIAIDVTTFKFVRRILLSDGESPIIRLLTYSKLDKSILVEVL